jgi:GT2 family glycosyltransferase
VQEAFKGQYGTVGDDVADDVSLPSPADRRRVIVSDHDGAPRPTVDVIVCIHDALEDVRTCLWSLAHKTFRPFRLILVDDGSAPETTGFLRSFAEQHRAVTLVTNDTAPHGYTIAVNLGLRESTGDYVVLLNSDTVVTFGWLDRIVAWGEARPRTGILGPLSNAATHQSVPDLRDGLGWATNPLPHWLTPDGLALAVRLLGVRANARLPFINGFCFVVKRAVIDTLGEFDEERFASGYCEENDYAQRARDAGFSTAVVDDAYVFHAKSKSFGVDGRKALARRNYEVFLDKHGRERIEALVRGMEADPSLAPVRDAVRTFTGSPEAYARSMRDSGVRPLTVVFVLPGISDGGSGGSHSVYQEVRGLRDLGVPARIAIAAKGMDRARTVYGDADEVFEPFRDARDLAMRTRDADVISATHNASVEMLVEVRRTRDDFLPAYYVQDYEPLFTQADPAQVQAAIASYTAIDDMLLFAKTHWLCNVVGERHGVYVAKVEPSIDTDVYFHRDEPHDHDVLRVTAMIRPRTPRRQPFSTIHVLERLLEAFPGRVEVETFGCTDQALAKVTRSSAITARHRGILTRTEVADLLRRTDVFLDMSMYQAFGRTAAEAMACGATAVLPRLGGAWEFAQQDHNAILVDTFDRQACFEALAALVDDRPRVERLRAAARETAERFSVARAALSEYAVFEHAHRERFGPR